MEPENIKLSNDYLSKLDLLYQVFPALRQEMPVMGAVWVQSRLTNQVRNRIKEAPSPARPSM